MTLSASKSFRQQAADTAPAAPPRPEASTVPSSGEEPSSADNKPGRRVALFGLVKRKEKWTLSTRGRLVVLGALLICGWAFIHWIQPFLAVTDRVDTRYLVVEGWVPNYALREAITEFKSKPYKMIFTVGSDPLTGVNVEEGDSLAIGAYERLKWLGINPDQLKAVPAHVKYRNRTFQSAVALQKWAEENHVPLTSFNVVTLGAHARRSRLLFEKAFDGHARVGIIAVENREYDPRHWWKYSEGLRQVIVESMGYVYARVLFHPDKQ